MLSLLFPTETGLLISSRPRPLSIPAQRIGTAELIPLAMCGIAAAIAAALPDFITKVPGHAILRPVLPILCGLALVPRRGAGTLMSLCSLGTIMILPSTLGRSGFGNVTSLLALGPALDLAMIRAGSGWRIYVRCIAAAMAANLVAWGVRFGAAALGWGGIAGSSNWTYRLGSYAVCGAVAGLIGAVVWFRFAARPASEDYSRDGDEPEPSR